VAMRKEAGLTQRQLAELLDREQSFVWRIEKGERRVDLLEFHWICNAMGQSSSLKYAEIANGFSAYDRIESQKKMVAEKRKRYRPKS